MNIPNDIFYEIISFIPKFELGSLVRVSKAWYSLIKPKFETPQYLNQIQGHCGFKLFSMTRFITDCWNYHKQKDHLQYQTHTHSSFANWPMLTSPLIPYLIVVCRQSITDLHIIKSLLFNGKNTTTIFETNSFGNVSYEPVYIRWIIEGQVFFITCDFISKLLVYKINENGIITFLHSFKSVSNDGLSFTFSCGTRVLSLLRDYLVWHFIPFQCLLNKDFDLFNAKYYLERGYHYSELSKCENYIILDQKFTPETIELEVGFINDNYNIDSKAFSIKNPKNSYLFDGIAEYTNLLTDTKFIAAHFGIDFYDPDFNNDTPGSSCIDLKSGELHDLFKNRDLKAILYDSSELLTQYGIVCLYEQRIYYCGMK